MFVYISECQVLNTPNYNYSLVGRLDAVYLGVFCMISAVTF